jgi:hypothetical protein
VSPAAAPVPETDQREKHQAGDRKGGQPKQNTTNHSCTRAPLDILALRGRSPRRYMISGKRVNPTFSGCVPSWISKPCRGAPPLDPIRWASKQSGFRPLRAADELVRGQSQERV